MIPKGYTLAGHVDVDSGSVWVGDPCYIIKDDGESRPKDLGSDWHDVCNTFFDRSGSNAYNDAWREHLSKLDRRLFDNQEWQDAMANQKADRNLYDKFLEIEEQKDPFVPDPKIKDVGFAEFNHDLGHSGMGIMLNTNYGDGTYPVYVKYGKNGRPSKILIDFGDY